MLLDDIPHIRLFHQQVTETRLATPVEMVRHLGAVQSQDFAGAKWSLGLRLRPVSDAAIEAAFDRGDILRTHILRPTWHFVLPEDIRWMLALTAPRVHQANKFIRRQLGLDESTLIRGGEAIARALRGGESLTRNELRDALERVGISMAGGINNEGQRLAHIVMWAELEGLICSGPRRGKQFTYMLLDERAPNARTMAEDEALAELTRRYFLSRGPATVIDYAKWSGLTVTQARRGIDSVADELRREEVGGKTYWRPPTTAVTRAPSPNAYLMSVYDEYISGYKEYEAIWDEAIGARLMAMGNALQNIIVVDGRIVGTWRREFKKDELGVELNVMRAISDGEMAAIEKAAAQCGRFFEMDYKLL